ncbi:MAG TPA: hypothetical protein VNA17_09930 [Pyrinomonadaceae bacterium]|nr:hypothetical protein [Pyrinomonadaceae bacterium]
MKDSCLDIGIIQSFLDGEISHNESARVSGHIAICDVCASMLAEAEDQSALVFSALDREFNSLVPTQRLWNKINDSLAAERHGRSFWDKAYAFLRVSLLNPSLAAAAGLLVVIGIFAVMFLNRVPESAMIAVNAPQVSAVQTSDLPPADGVPEATIPSTSTVRDEVISAEPTNSFRAERAAYRPESVRRAAAVPGATTVAANGSGGYLPGEESYVRTIRSLEETVEEQKAGGILRPSERIAYERDMAVVDDAIAKMKREVRRNPRNESAKQVLYSSYQNKIDLLNSVSQKEELLVSLK